MTSDNPNGGAGAAGKPLAKLFVVAAFVVIGVGAWILLRPGPLPELSAFAPAPAPQPTSRPLSSLPLVGIRQTLGPNGERRRVDLHELSQDRRQTGPDTFEIARTLIDSNRHTETSITRRIKIVPTAPDAMWPSANATPREVDLLAGLDLKGAVVRGQWTRGDDGSIQSDLEQLTRIDLGYRPPAEYDFQLTFSRLKGNDGLDTVLYAGGRQFYWTFAGWENTTSGFGTVLGQTAEANATTRKRRTWLTNGVTYTAVIKVRRDRVQVYLDGELVGDHATDYRDLNLILRTLRRTSTIGFSTWESGYAIKGAKLTEIAGQGERRGAPSATQPTTLPVLETAVAAVDFSVAGRPPGLYFLYPNGGASGTTTSGNWSVAGDKIVFRWGDFVDSCTLSPDRKSFSGRNQFGDAISGTVRAGAL